MRLLVASIIGAAVALFAVGKAAAHPLGNFTVNRYAGIELAGSEIYVRYALDLAEIPSYQLRDEVRRPGFAAGVARDLELALDGRRFPLRVVERRLTTSPGAGGLQTVRLDVVYAAESAGGTTLRFRDRAFPGRIGWREVTVAGRDGARVIESTVPATSESDALRTYPERPAQVTARHRERRGDDPTRRRSGHPGDDRRASGAARTTPEASRR